MKMLMKMCNTCFCFSNDFVHYPQLDLGKVESRFGIRLPTSKYSPNVRANLKNNG